MGYLLAFLHLFLQDLHPGREIVLGCIHEGLCHHTVDLAALLTIRDPCHERLRCSPRGYTVHDAPKPFHLFGVVCHCIESRGRSTHLHAPKHLVLQHLCPFSHLLLLFYGFNPRAPGLAQLTIQQFAQTDCSKAADLLRPHEALQGAAQHLVDVMPLGQVFLEPVVDVPAPGGPCCIQFTVHDFSENFPYLLAVSLHGVHSMSPSPEGRNLSPHGEGGDSLGEFLAQVEDFRDEIHPPCKGRRKGPVGEVTQGSPHAILFFLSVSGAALPGAKRGVKFAVPDPRDDFHCGLLQMSAGLGVLFPGR